MKKRLQVLFVVSLGCIFGVSLCYAESIWEKQQKASQEATPDATTSTSSIVLNEITIPSQYGSIIETHEGTNGKLIVHIQDAHANYEAQKNIAGILESLISNENLNLILREGSISTNDFTYIRDSAPIEERKKKADELLKKAIINAEEYLNIASDYPMSFQGIEERSRYDEFVSALWEMDKFKDIALEYVNKLTAAADSIKPKIYNAELLAMDKAKKDYENETIVLSAYYKILDDIIKKKNIAIEEFPNFAAFVKGEIKDLNINSLFKEELLVENKIHEAISENDDQKTLYKVLTALSVMDKMLRVKLVPEEYEYFLDNKKDFDPQVWADFLKEKSDESNLGLNIPNNYFAISDNLLKVEKFYRLAGEREKAFLTKTEERMKKDNVQIAALITGGFHTPTLTQLLSDAGYSYIVVSPRVTTKTDDDLYRSTLKREWLPELK
nr:hypothetical protein [Candidatus Omnitrophota bacterium]